MPIRVVIVDDHPLVREGLKRLFAHCGITIVGEAADGAESLHVVRSVGPDVVLMDLMMPGMHGVEATRALAAEHPDLPVIILTASEEDADLFEAIRAGARGYVLKSLDISTVVSLVQRAAKGEPVFAPRLAARLLDEFARQGREQTTTSPKRPAVTWYQEGVRAPLTQRERDVLQLVVTGAKNKDIAERLGLAETTVKYHLRQILLKLHVQNRTEAVAHALTNTSTPPADAA